MIDRVKRWLAGCGEDCESRVCKLERPSAGRTQNLRVFFLFAFSLSIVLSERAKVNEAQEHRNDEDRRGTTADSANNDDSFASCEEQFVTNTEHHTEPEAARPLAPAAAFEDVWMY